MKILVKIVRENEQTDNVVLKAVAVIKKIDKEKLHHPELRPRIEAALKDFHLQLEEGKETCFSRILGQEAAEQEIYDFKNYCVDMFDFIEELEIPPKEENRDNAMQVIEPATDEEMDFVKSWLNDFKDDELYYINYISLWKNGIGHGRIAGPLMKKLLTTFLQAHE